MPAKSNFPGSIYLNKNRWWWRVRLPNQSKYTSIPLKPDGAKFATKNYDVACAVAESLWRKAIRGEQGQPVNLKDTSIKALIPRYLAYCRGYYRKSREAYYVEFALLFLIEIFPHSQAEDFGPLMLKQLQQHMVSMRNKDGRQKWARSTINQRIGMIKRFFKWCASEELIPTSCYLALTTVEGLKKGRTEARENRIIKPVPEIYIERILPFTSKVVADMVRIQNLTGMRSSELCNLRPIDIDVSGDIWIYKPVDHKTAWLDKIKIIPLGPKVQRILKSYLNRKVDCYCFSPKEAYPKNAAQLHGKYDKDSYRRAIKHAIKAAKKKGVDVIEFHPHQLRHNAATRIRKEIGLDAARAVLGHTNLRMTDEYAEIDRGLACQAAEKLG